jgi:hypothetical protein
VNASSETLFFNNFIISFCYFIFFRLKLNNKKNLWPGLAGWLAVWLAGLLFYYILIKDLPFWGSVRGEA